MTETAVPAAVVAVERCTGDRLAEGVLPERVTLVSLPALSFATTYTVYDVLSSTAVTVSVVAVVSVTANDPATAAAVPVESTPAAQFAADGGVDPGAFDSLKSEVGNATYKTDVAYTHLTLPTVYPVYISGVAGRLTTRRRHDT